MQSALFLSINNMSCLSWGFIIAFVVWSRAEAENIASLTGAGWGSQLNGSATQELNVPVLIPLPAAVAKRYFNL